MNRVGVTDYSEGLSDTKPAAVYHTQRQDFATVATFTIFCCTDHKVNYRNPVWLKPG